MVDWMQNKTDCHKCKYNVQAGFFNRPHCVVTNPAEELTSWYIMFINPRGCMCYDPVEKWSP